MAWQQSVDQGSLQVLEVLWIWAEESEINSDELLLAHNFEWIYCLPIGSREQPFRNTKYNVGLG